MKKTGFFLVIIFLTSLAANAQRFKGGILGGINASQIDGDTWGGYYKLGLVAGAFVYTDLADKWEGQLEIKYASKGSANGFNVPYPIKISLQYIDLPVLAAYSVTDNLKLQAGISVNYLFNARRYDGSWFDEWDFEPNSLETSLTFGVNYRFFQSFDMNIRYSYSILPVRSKSAIDDWGHGAWFNNVVSFALYFEIGSKDF